MSAWDDWIGRTEVRTDVLTPALVDRFRATLDNGIDDDFAPQGIHWLTCVPDAPTVQLGEDGHPLRSNSPDGFFPPIPLPRRMWAASKVQFLAPIVAGAAIARRSTIASVVEKSGASGALAFVDVAHETMADGVPAIRETQTLVYREAAAPSLPPAAPSDNLNADLSAWTVSRSLVPSQALLFRYSALTFNTHRIHYDAPYAREVEAYRGLVVHGPLMASLLLDLVAREFGPNRLCRFAFRALTPAFCGERLHLVARQQGDTLALATLGADGRTCVSAEAAFDSG